MFWPILLFCFFLFTFVFSLCWAWTAYRRAKAREAQDAADARAHLQAQATVREAQRARRGLNDRIGPISAAQRKRWAREAEARWRKLRAGEQADADVRVRYRSLAEDYYGHMWPPLSGVAEQLALRPPFVSDGGGDYGGGGASGAWEAPTPSPALAPTYCAPSPSPSYDDSSSSSSDSGSCSSSSSDSSSSSSGSDA